MGRQDIAVVVLQDEAPCAVKDASLTASEPRGMLAGRDRSATSFHTNEPNGAIVDERVEDPQRVAAAADTRHDQIWKSPGRLENLCARLLADHRLKLAHHQGIRMRPKDRPE